MAVLRNSTSENVEGSKFARDVAAGLSSTPKFLSSRYFYDAIGDKLFQDIMNMPEYYLTNAEFEIMSKQGAEIIKALGLSKDTYFELVELGAGDGTKTKELLKVLLAEGYNFDYMPIDISQDVLDGLSTSLNKELEDLSVHPQQGDYFDVLASFKDSEHPKVVLFLGSNLGNMEDEQAHDFLYQLGSNLKKDDKLFLGLDQIKSVDIVLPAYDDPQKITAQFNLNLLVRMNRELGANFDLEWFEHAPEYTEEEGIAKSFLVSKRCQMVYIKELDSTVEFREGEKIHTEISRKYNDVILGKILGGTDFKVTDKLMDSKQYFADYILTRG